MQRSALASFAMAVAACSVLGSAASAHHSFAMFDNQKTVTIEGTVRDFQWTNPHCWIQVVVRNPAGKTTEWSVEGGSPNVMTREGWKRNSIKVGDKVKVTMRPLKDGSTGGSLIYAYVNNVRIGVESVNGVPIGRP